MGIWVPSMAPKHCGKFHFLWKPFRTNQELRSFVNFHACCRSTDSKFVSYLSVVQSFSYAFEQHRYDCFYRYRLAQSGYLLLKAVEITH